MMTRNFFLLFILLASSNACKQEDTPDHCADGRLNFEETSIDCGGSCIACLPPTCTDGIQNQSEFAIDCGGPCAACEAFFSGVVDYKNILLVEGAAEYVMSTSVNSKTLSVSSCSKDFHSLLFNPGRTNSISVTFKALYSGNCAGPDSSAFHSLFSTGSKMYAENDLDDGVLITWYDKDGKAWKTTLGPQNTGTFEVTSSEIIAPSSSYERHKIQASFNCKLYDDSGNYLPVLNGTITVYFGNK